MLSVFFSLKGMDAVWMYHFSAMAFALLFMFGSLAGLLLAEKPRLGIRLSAVYEGLQIVKLHSPMIVYQLY